METITDNQARALIEIAYNLSDAPSEDGVRKALTKPVVKKLANHKLSLRYKKSLIRNKYRATLEALTLIRDVLIDLVR